MRRILLISSYVARDPVGITATAPPLQLAGIEVVALPTVVLSNHPVRAHMAGLTLEPKLLSDMAGALEANGWFGTFDAVFSGYLPSAEHVHCVGKIVERVRAARPDVLYVCDPIFGDDPGGLYIAEEAAVATRDVLVPLADVLTPNRFELGWLTGVDVRSVADAARAALLLRRPIIAATSIPVDRDRLASLLVAGYHVLAGEVERLDDVPHGTGDVFAGFLTAGLMNGAGHYEALSCAMGGVKTALQASRGSDRLLISAIDWTRGIARVDVRRLL